MADHGIEMVRYADDFVILLKAAEPARRLELGRQWVADNGLALTRPSASHSLPARRERKA